jgi:hypothetical protein
MITLDKTTKEAYLIDVAIPNTRSFHSSLTKKLQKYRLERRAYKNMATENGLYNTSSIIHNRYYSKQITWKFKTA